ncbi:MAG: methionyl-tRNA formyltransferase [Candidatus Sericytochromatia bacterium]|nr:methionyl-tRNA formyltransferase [Candidatus Sericytochromatia bacterium]
MLHIIASRRPDTFRAAVERLEARTGCRFLLVEEPSSLTVERLEELNPGYIFFPHWSHRIPEAIFSRFTCVIFHMTDLPYGRGGSPLQNLILRGHRDTQMSALRCVAEMDAGPVYIKRPLSLEGSAEQIYNRAYALIEDMIATILIEKPEAVPQSGEVTVFTRRRPEESSMGALQSLSQVYDHVRMLDADGYPHAFLDAGPFRIYFREAEAGTEEVRASVRMVMREQP